MSLSDPLSLLNIGKESSPGLHRLSLVVKATGGIEKGVAAMNGCDGKLIRGSGNVFRDFGDPVADIKQAKAILAARIIAVLDERKLTVRKAASATGFAAADFSRVRSADLGRFTLDRLIRMLSSLDDTLEVTLRIAPRPDVQDPTSY